MLKLSYFCDECGKEHFYNIRYNILPSQKQLISLIKIDGWSFDERILCSKCNAKKVAE